VKHPRISVITPTFNRAHTLPALRASLVAQDFKDFEWIIVDDGSSDDTSVLLETWKREGGIGMVVITRENGGKHRALNGGINAASGEWIFIVDSDDKLPASSLRTLDSFAKEADANPHACGIMGLKTYSDGRVVGENLPVNVRYANALELTYRYGIRGDKAEAYKADVLKKFPFPEFEGECFLTEAVVWYRMARAGWTLLLCQEILYESTYHADGLSAQSLRIRIDNPKGTLLFYKEEIEGDLPLSGALREAANYVRFSLHARHGTDKTGSSEMVIRCATDKITESEPASLSPPAKRLIHVARPAGYLAWCRDRIALRKRNRETKNE
jgi:glycosyltransferase involved in cell wall biosynthesis